MSTNLNVNEPVSLRSFSATKSDHRAEGGTIGVIGLLIAVGLVLFAVGNIYLLNSVIGPTHLPFQGQFVGP